MNKFYNINSNFIKLNSLKKYLYFCKYFFEIFHNFNYYEFSLIHSIFYCYKYFKSIMLMQKIIIID